MLEVKSVWQYYGASPILKGIDLTIDRPGVVVIVGPNGIGKSTMLRVLGGVLEPQQGSVWIDGKRRRSSPDAELEIRKQSVFLPDDVWMPTRRTPLEWLYDIGRIWSVPVPRLASHLELLFDLFDLKQQAKSPIGSLSTGQKKKVALCSALVTETKWMFLDEPFSGGLDSAGILALMEVLKRFSGQNSKCKTTVVMTTPVAELVAQLADRVILLRDGQIAFDGSVGSLRSGFDSATPLSVVLEHQVRPDAEQAIKRYLDWHRVDG